MLKNWKTRCLLKRATSRSRRSAWFSAGDAISQLQRRRERAIPQTDRRCATLPNAADSSTATTASTTPAPSSTTNDGASDTEVPAIHVDSAVPQNSKERANHTTA